MNFSTKNALNISLVLLSLFQGWLKVANSQETIWYTSNVTVTRNVLSQDYFDFWSNKGKQECLLSIRRRVCEDFGGTQAKTDCKELCCKRCICRRNKPTFLAQKCVEDRNITAGVSDTNHFVLDTVPGALCANSTRLPTLNISRLGKQKFLICLNGVQIPQAQVKRCSLVTNQEIIVKGWNGSVARIPGKNSFQITSAPLQMKWSEGLTFLQGHIVSLPVKCDLEKFNGPREVEQHTVQSSLYFKVPGSQTGPGSKVIYHVIPALSTPTPVTSASVSGSVVMTTPSDYSTKEYKSKLNIVHVSGQIDVMLVVLAAILGSLLFVVIGSAVIAIIVVIRRKQKLNISGKHASNPTYERGPDEILINGGPRQATYKVASHFYQPLVENTRMVPGSGKDPIYESLDDNLREINVSLTENPNRCSLAYCDVTSDGYLIPTGDEHTPPKPPATLPNIPDSNKQHSRPRLSSSYDEPEVVILDRKPKHQAVEECNYDEVNEVKLPDDKKPTYQELEGDTKERVDNEGDSQERADTDDMQYPNESVSSDIYKNPSENSYLELIGDVETKSPLESEIL